MKLGTARMVKSEVLNWLKAEIKNPSFATDRGIHELNALIRAVKSERRDMVDAWRIKLDFEAVMGSKQGEISWRSLSANVITYYPEIN